MQILKSVDGNKPVPEGFEKLNYKKVDIIGTDENGNDIFKGEIVKTTLPTADPTYWKWDEANKKPKNMTASEKTIKDNLIIAEIAARPRESKEILNDMFSAFSGIELDNILDLLDSGNATVFLRALDNYNYPLAASRLLKLKTSNKLTISQHDTILSMIPGQ